MTGEPSALAWTFRPSYVILLRRSLAWLKARRIVSNSWLYIDIILVGAEQVRIVVVSEKIDVFLSYLRTFVKCARIL